MVDNFAEEWQSGRATSLLADTTSASYYY